jgi:hypothetical protein
MKTTYTPTPEIDTGGTFLVAYLPGVTPELLQAAFGAYEVVGVSDDAAEKGYDGQEWYFTSSRGEVFTVYSRWGEFRIGSREGTDVDSFKGWLLGELSAPGLN